MCIIIYNKIILHPEKYVNFLIFFIFYIILNLEEFKYKYNSRYKLKDDSQ